MLILFRKIHDVGGKDNFKRLSKELILLYSKLSPQKIKESGIASDKVFTYEKDGAISYKVDFTDDKIEVTKTITGFGSFNQNNSISSDDVDYQFKPFETIGLRLTKPLSFAAEITPNQIIPVPAIYLAWLIEENRTQENIDHAWMTLNFATLAFGVSELTMITNASRLYRMRQAIGLVEVAKFPVDLAFADDDICLSMQNLVGNEEFCETWRQISIIADIILLSGNVVSASPQLGKKLENAWSNLKAKNPNLRNTIGSSKFDAVEEMVGVGIENFVEGVVNGIRRYNIGEEIANGATNITRNITINGNNFTLKWIVDENGIILFGNRSDLAKIIGTIEEEAHHILTWTRSSVHSVVQAAAKDGFHLNTFENGIGLAKYRKSLSEGLHGNHPAYDDYVVHKLSEFRRDNFSFTHKSANEYIQMNLIPHMKDLINDAAKSTYNLNEYFKKIVNPSVGILLK